MTVIIFELEFPSHYHFIQYLLPRLSRRFDEVLVAVMDDAEQDPHFLNTIKQYESLAGVNIMKVFEMVPPISDTQIREHEEDMARQRNFARLEKILAEYPADHLITLSADKLIPMIANRLASNPETPFARVDMHIGVHWLLPVPLPEPLESQGASSAPLDNTTGSGKRGTATWNNHQKQMLDLLQIRPDSIMFQNIAALEKFRRYAPELAARSFLNPIPIEVFEPVDKHQARMKLGLPSDGKLIGFAGSIQKRKGIPLFLNAFRLARLNPEDRMLLIGPFDDFEIAGIVEREHQDLVDQGRLILRDEVLDTHSLHVAISAFDVLVCNLTRHRWSSDMALRAAMAERPILASDEEWFRHMVRKYAIGTLVPEPRDERSTARYIEQSLKDSSHFAADPRIKELKAFNDPENYASAVMDYMFNKKILPSESHASRLAPRK